MVDILRPKTWVRYKPANCASCTAGCCTLPVRIPAEDLYHMGFVEYDEVNGSPLKIAKRLIKQGIVRSYNRRTGLFTLKRLRNSDCIFLDENRRCKIYERRPSICRRFPDNAVRRGYCPTIKK